MKLREIKEYYNNVNLHKHYFLDEDDLLQGEYKTWYENGNSWEICNYKNGKKHGEFKEWDDAGKLVIDCIYKNEILHGKYYINYKYIEMGNFINNDEYGIGIVKKMGRKSKKVNG